MYVRNVVTQTRQHDAIPDGADAGTTTLWVAARTRLAHLAKRRLNFRVDDPDRCEQTGRNICSANQLTALGSEVDPRLCINTHRFGLDENYPISVHPEQLQELVHELLSVG